MQVLITGATGFIGSGVYGALRRRKDGVRVVSRSQVTVAAELGQEAESVPLDTAPRKLLAGIDAIVNLMGEPIIGRRWSRAQKERLRESRVDGTRRLVDAIRALDPAARPKTLVSGSAIGFYGARGDQELAEDAVGGNDFLAGLCAEWEAAALAARELGVRVVIVRTGIVLGTTGGALQRMLLPFRLGLGGPIGSGRQYMSWIHRDDMVGMVLHALDKPAVMGVLNGTAPTPVTNRDFTRALARAVHRPAFFPVPAFGLRLALGEGATLLVDGQRVVPRRALDAGYVFRHPTLDDALRSLLPKG